MSTRFRERWSLELSRSASAIMFLEMRCRTIIESADGTSRSVLKDNSRKANAPRTFPTPRRNRLPGPSDSLCLPPSQLLDGFSSAKRDGNGREDSPMLPSCCHIFPVILNFSFSSYGLQIISPCAKARTSLFACPSSSTSFALWKMAVHWSPLDGCFFGL